jgi:hypothetical protein
MIFPANGFEYYGWGQYPHTSIPGKSRTVPDRRLFVTVPSDIYLRVPIEPGVRARCTMKVFPVLTSEKNDTREKYMIID